MWEVRVLGVNHAPCIKRHAASQRFPSFGIEIGRVSHEREGRFEGRSTMQLHITHMRHTVCMSAIAEFLMFYCQVQSA